jgi:hypothetical protein
MNTTRMTYASPGIVDNGSAIATTRSQVVGATYEGSGAGLSVKRAETCKSAQTTDFGTTTNNLD